MKVAEGLKKYRKKHEITQAKMAALLGVTITTLSRWENEHTEPQHKLIRQRIEEVIGGSLQVGEALGGHPDLLSALHWRAEELADKDPEHVKVEHKKKEVLIRLKVK